MRKLNFLVAMCFSCICAFSQQNIGIGTNNPKSKVDVSGNLTVGSGYSGTNAAPANGAIIQGQVGIGTASPNASAILDMSTASPGNKGVLFPNVALTSSTDVSTIPNPKQGLVAYNTGTGGLSPAGMYQN